MSNKDQDKKWLVKNGNKIIGPFSEKGLQTELAKDYISPFATACVPGQSFWGFLAAYPEFVAHTDITKLTQFTKTLNTDFTRTHKMISEHIKESSTSPGTLLKKKEKKLKKLILVCFLLVVCVLVWSF